MIPLAILDFVSTWWNDLGVAKQVFYGIGLLSGIVAVFLCLMAMFGFGHHDATDALHAHGDNFHDGQGGGAGILSLKPLTGFFLGFGWGGGMALDNNIPFGGALACAFVAGAMMMGIIILLYRFILSMRSDGTMRIDAAVGAVGTVYVTLPPTRGAGGQVTVNFQNRQETLPALNAGAHAIASGEKVRVIEVVDSRTLLVEKL